MLTLSRRGSTIGISSIAFISAGAVPFFSYLIGLNGSLCLAPTCVRGMPFEATEGCADTLIARHSGLDGSIHGLGGCAKLLEENEHMLSAYIHNRIRDAHDDRWLNYHDHEYS